MKTRSDCVSALIGSRHQSLFWQGSSGRHLFAANLAGLNGIISGWFTNNCHAQNLDTIRIHCWCQSQTLCQPQFPSSPGQPWSTLMLQTESPGQRGEEKQTVQTTQNKTGVFPDIQCEAQGFCSSHCFTGSRRPWYWKYLNRARKSNNFRWQLV